MAISVHRVGGIDWRRDGPLRDIERQRRLGSDYTAASGTLNWADGDSTDRTINVAILQDGDLESPEQFTLSLDNPGGGATLGLPSTTTVTIFDDETDQAPISNAGPAAGGVEGSPIQLDGTASDQENPTPTIVWSAQAGLGVDPSAFCSLQPRELRRSSVTCTDDGTWNC